MTARGSARVYSFGIGENVSDALLHALAEKSGGAVEMIHPGERIDEKVVGQFARATAPRVTDVTIKTRGIELGELAPAEARALVDGEPYCLFATYEAAGHGAIELRGKRDGEAFYLEIPVELEAASERPVVEKLWAQARIRDLERSTLDGRRASAMKDRIVKLATTYGVSSKYTSFVVVEKRTGDRRANAQPETRVVPVNAPAGWQGTAQPDARQRSYSTRSGSLTPMAATALRAPMASMGAPMPGMGAPRPMPSAPMVGTGAPPPPPAASYAPRSASPMSFGDEDVARSPKKSAPMPPPAARRIAPSPAAFDDEDEGIATMVSTFGAKGGEPDGAASGAAGTGDPALDILARQAASGLWEKPGSDATLVTIDALLGLLRLGLSTTHGVYGAQMKKAIDALLERLAATTVPPRTRELALGLAWLLTSGRRTRTAIEDAAKGSALAASLGDASAVRAHVEQLAV